jgi:hypothetical protein
MHRNATQFSIRRDDLTSESVISEETEGSFSKSESMEQSVGVDLYQGSMISSPRLDNQKL